MKFSKIIILSVAIVAVSMIYLSCTKDTPRLANFDNTLNQSSLVQIFNATVKAARNYAYVDAVPVSGAPFVFNGVSPGTAFGYRVAPGFRIFLIRDTAAVTTQAPLSFSENFNAGTSYTIFMYDTITSPKQLTVQNNIEKVTDTTSRLRFANFIYNTTALPAVDVYSFRRGTTTPVFSNVATNSVTPFIPYQSLINDTLYVYATGTTTPLLVKQLVTGLTPQRSYTSAYAGSYKATRTITTFLTY